MADDACLAPGSRCVADATGQDCDETDPRICLACAGGATLTFDGKVRGAGGLGWWGPASPAGSRCAPNDAIAAATSTHPATQCLPNCRDTHCDADPSIGCPESPETCQLW